MDRKRRLGATDLHIAPVSFGASPFAGVTQADEAVCRAIELGVNFFDTAPLYSSDSNRSEEILGKALSHHARSSFFVNTKCGTYGKGHYDYSAATVVRSVNESLRRLQLSYVDCITCHDIEFAPDIEQIIRETLPALRDLQKQGKVRYVGISGYPLETLLFVARRVPLDFVLTYCHYNLQNSLLEQHAAEFRSLGCGLLNASPLGMGLLTQKGAAPWHPAPADLRAAAQEAARACDSHGVDLANLALQWTLCAPLAQDGTVATTLIGISKAAEIEAAVAQVGKSPDAVVLATVSRALEPVDNHTWAAWKHKPVGQK